MSQEEVFYTGRLGSFGELVNHKLAAWDTVAEWDAGERRWWGPISQPLVKEGGRQWRRWHAVRYCRSPQAVAGGSLLKRTAGFSGSPGAMCRASDGHSCWEHCTKKGAFRQHKRDDAGKFDMTTPYTRRTGDGDHHLQLVLPVGEVQHMLRWLGPCAWLGGHAKLL